MLNGLLRKLRSGVLAAMLSWGASAGDTATTDVLRLQKDAARDREWILTPRGVVVLNHKARGTATFVDLPGWIWAGEAYMCPPDLALGPKGEALVSSNVVPSLWRIDPVTLRVTRHTLVLDAHLDKDVGFTGVTYAPQLGVFFAVSDSGALWRIDPLLRRAQEVAMSEPVQRACGLTTLAPNPRRRFPRLFGLCVQAGGRHRAIYFAPDQRSAYVGLSCSR